MRTGKSWVLMWHDEGSGRGDLHRRNAEEWTVSWMLRGRVVELKKLINLFCPSIVVVFSDPPIDTYPAQSPMRPDPDSPRMARSPNSSSDSRRLSCGFRARSFGRPDVQRPKSSFPYLKDTRFEAACGDKISG